MMQNGIGFMFEDVRDIFCATQNTKTQQCAREVEVCPTTAWHCFKSSDETEGGSW
jgi:hypothetical protein